MGEKAGRGARPWEETRKSCLTCGKQWQMHLAWPGLWGSYIVLTRSQAVACLSKPIKGLGILPAQFPERFRCCASAFGHDAYGKDRVGGFVAASPPGIRSQIGAIGFYEDAVVRDEWKCLSGQRVVFEGDGARHGDVPVVGIDALDEFLVLAEAVPDKRPAGKAFFLEYGKCVFDGVPAVDGDRHVKLFG